MKGGCNTKWYMRIVMQRVTRASVEVAGETVGSIGRGLLLLLGITHADTTAQADLLAAKIAGLRIFSDDDGKMNRSVQDVAGSILVVSQFTLYGDTRKGRRPVSTKPLRRSRQRICMNTLWSVYAP